MKFIIPILLLISSFARAQTGSMPIIVGTGISAATSCSCVYTTTLTIVASYCGASDDVNFPVLVSYTDARFKNVANGGHVYQNRFQIEFYLTAGDTTSLASWIIESY